MKEIPNIEKKIRVVFKNKNLLTQAFCHRSYVNENPDFKLGNNERLEFLGDAVLELSVTECLYRNYPDSPEGDLTSWRASLVNTKMLSETIKEMGINDFILLSKGEAKDLGKLRSSILANVFEALIGAIYLDSGYDKCYKFVEENLIRKLPQIIESGSYKDVKSRFQEESQRHKSTTPNYKIIKEWGPDHKKKFKIGAFLNETLVATGEGLSRQEAEENAAKKALKIKKW